MSSKDLAEDLYIEFDSDVYGKTVEELEKLVDIFHKARVTYQNDLLNTLNKTKSYENNYNQNTIGH